MRRINVSDCTSFIKLGICGENRATEVVFDLTGYINQFGDGYATLLNMRPNDKELYPVTTTVEGNSLKWILSETDMERAGNGAIQLNWYVNGTIAKSDVFRTYIKKSINDPDENPVGRPDWVNEVVEAGASSQDGAKRAEQALKDVEIVKTDVDTKAEEVAGNLTKSETALDACETAVTQAHGFAEASEKFAANAKTSENNSAQAYSDLLSTIGTSVPELVGGKIPMSQIPATATTEIYRVSSDSELTSLVAQKGDLAELVEDVNGEQTITKTWQLLGTDPKLRENWIVWGTSYAVQSGSSTLSDNAKDSERINGMRFVTMNYSDFESAVKDPDTLYAVDMGV